MGVWIETEMAEFTEFVSSSHPSWVCGLKLMGAAFSLGNDLSHPSWVCGLKLLEQKTYVAVIVSHPSWVCGLKLNKIEYLKTAYDVTPFVGVWIETAKTQMHQRNA